MKKNLGVVRAVQPMPVLVVAAYDEEGRVNPLAAGWGMICNFDKIAVFIDLDHKTSECILKKKAFTVAVADIDHMVETDFFGLVSGHDVPDKFEKSGLTARKSEFVDAPVIEEYPITMECELVEVFDNDNFEGVLGRIVNTVADEEVLDENGKVEATKLNALSFDCFTFKYMFENKFVGQGYSIGEKLNK